MLRVLTLTTILGLGFTLGPAFAADDKEANCDGNTAIVQRLVELRLAGVWQKKAIRIMTEGDDAVADNYKLAVPQYASWIYSQPKRDAERFEAEAFKKQCMSL